MKTKIDPIQNNPPTLSDNVNPDTKPSVEITDQKAIADGDGSITYENPEIDTDVSHASDCQEVEVTEVFLS